MESAEQKVKEFHNSLDTGQQLKLTDIVYRCANFTLENPDCLLQIGVAWYMNDKIIINSKILGLFVNFKPNTMNRNLRQHGFPILRKVSFDLSIEISKTFPELHMLKGQAKWIIRQCPPLFHRFASEEDQKKIKFIQPLMLKRKNRISMELTKNDTQIPMPILGDQSSQNMEPEMGNSSMMHLQEDPVFTIDKIDETFLYRKAPSTLFEESESSIFSDICDVTEDFQDTSSETKKFSPRFYFD